jgi:hypothetical protein
MWQRHVAAGLTAAAAADRCPALNVDPIGMCVHAVHAIRAVHAVHVGHVGHSMLIGHAGHAGHVGHAGQGMHARHVHREPFRRACVTVHVYRITAAHAQHTVHTPRCMWRCQSCLSMSAAMSAAMTVHAHAATTSTLTHTQTMLVLWRRCDGTPGYACSS